MANDTEYKEIVLKKPIDIDGAKITTLRMREPTVEDQLAAEKFSGSDGERELMMFSHLCEVTPTDIKKMTMRDYKGLQTAFLAFIN